MSFSIKRIARFSKAANRWPGVISSSLVDDMIVRKASEADCDVAELLQCISSEARDRIKARVARRPKCVSEVVLGMGVYCGTEVETAQWYKQREQEEFDGLNRLAEGLGVA